MSVNKVILLGRLGKDPEVRYTSSQMAIGRFSLATNDRKKDQSGNWVDHTDWHNIVVFGKTAENCSKFIKKGSEIFVEGKIRTSKWQDKEGKDRYTTEILADNVRFVGGKRSDIEMQSNSEMPVDSFLDSIPSADAIATTSKAQAAVSQPITFDDDDIPF